MRRTYEEIVVDAPVIDFNNEGGVSSSQLALNEIIAIELIWEIIEFSLGLKLVSGTPLSLIKFVLKT